MTYYKLKANISKTTIPLNTIIFILYIAPIVKYRKVQKDISLSCN